MSSEQRVRNPAAAEKPQDMSIDSAEAYHASQIEENNRTCKMYRFVQKKDEFNVNICGILGKILKSSFLSKELSTSIAT